MLRVLSGPQSGGQLALRDEGSMLVGSDEASCDIVLFGAGVAAGHCRLETVGMREVAVHVVEGAAVHLNGQLLDAGRHVFEVPAHLRLGEVDVLAYMAPEADSAIDDGLLSDDAEPLPRPSSRRLAVRWAAGAVCVAGFTACVSGAMGWFDKADPPEIAGARRLAAQLGYRDLAVAYDVEGQLTVTGYVRSAQEAEQIRRAFRGYPAKGVAVRVAVAGAATQVERQPARPAGETHRLGAGSVLIEPQPAGVATAPRAGVNSSPAGNGNPLEIQVRALRAGDDGYIETTSGIRYFVGSQMPGGYTLKAVSDTALVVSRDEVETEVPLRR